MALRLIFKNNTKEIRDTLKKEGFNICSCANDTDFIYYCTTPKWYLDRGVSHIHGINNIDIPDKMESADNLAEFIEKAKKDKLANE